MTMNYAYTPHIWPSAFTALVLVALAVYSRRRRSVPGSLPFTVACLFAMLHAAGSILTYLAVDPQTKIFWFRFMASAWLPTSTAITCFILEYAWPGRWLTRHSLILLSIFPLLGIFYFFSAGYLIKPMPAFSVAEFVTAPLGPISTIFVIYFFALTLVNLIVFTWLFIRSPRHRWPVVLMVGSQIALRVAFLREAPSVNAIFFDVPVFTLPFLTYAIALFGFRIFDPIPQARRMAVDQLQAGVVVLDSQERVVSINPAAERILEITANHARDHPVREWLPAYPEGLLMNLDGSEIEFYRSSGREPRCYSLAISQLKDFRGLDIGKLLMVRDITEQKQAQAQILEQQRTLATQDERERLARELHDSLGQVLSYTSLQVETAAQLSIEGQGEAAAAQLARLGGVVRDAHADLREHILNLHSTTFLEQPFIPAAKQYLESFTRSYPVQTLLSVDPDLGEAAFPPETRLQLLRILQEAVSNARKHGKARQVQVSLMREDARLCLTIQDDGCGFDPQEVECSGHSHYGLQFMRDRAEVLGGSLQVQSAPGSGTRVELVIPQNIDTETRGWGERERETW